MFKALSRFRYGTRMLTAGDEFEAPRQHGRALIAVGRATYATKEILPEDKPAKKPRRRRKKAESE